MTVEVSVDDIKNEIYHDVLNHIDAEISPLVTLIFDQKNKAGISNELRYLIEKLYGAFFSFRVKIRDTIKDSRI